MSAWRRTVRVAGGLLVIGCGVGLVLGARELPVVADLESAAIEVAIPPSDVTLVCSGASAAATQAGSDNELSGASSVTGQVFGAVLARDGEIGSARWGSLSESTDDLQTGPAAAVGYRELSAQASVLVAEPTDQAGWATASAIQRADSGDLRGLAASSCPSASATAWFAAGETTVSSSVALTMRNPGQTPASVSLRVWDAIGEVPIDLPAIVVAPGEEVTELMESIAPDVERLVVSVTATGGRISATMTTQRLDGLTPNGVDLVAPTASPDTEVVIPGAVLAESAVTDADPALVRVLNTADEAATIDISLVAEDGVVPLTPDGMVVDPGAVADVSLAGVPAGVYSVRVSADQPVVAGAMLVRLGAPAPEDPDVPVVDRAWLSAVPPVDEFAIALGAAPELIDGGHLVIATGSDADTALSLTTYDEDGEILEESSLDIMAGGHRAISLEDLGAAAIVQVSADAPVSGAITLQADSEFGELVSSMTAQPDPQVERSAQVAVSLN